jgi:acyl-CoA hydrolase
MKSKMEKIIMPGSLNAASSLYGGELMKWVDEAAAIYAICQLGTKHVVTKKASFNFMAPAVLADIIKISVEVIKFGTTSITLHVLVTNKDTKQVICALDDMVFVSIDPETKRPTPHGKTEVKVVDED